MRVKEAQAIRGREREAQITTRLSRQGPRGTGATWSREGSHKEGLAEGERSRRPEVPKKSKDDRDGRLHRQARRPCSQAREEYSSAPPAEKARAQVSQGPRLHSEDPTTTANPHGSWGGEKHPDLGTGTSALRQSTRVGAAPGVGSTARTWPQGRQHGGATRAPSRHATRLSRAPSRPVTRLRHILAHLLSPSAALTPSEVLAESRPSTPCTEAHHSLRLRGTMWASIPGLRTGNR